MFTSVTIKNFRLFEQLTINNLKRLNLFVGKNNAGKTAILESIFLLTSPKNIQLNLNINAFRGLIVSPANIEYIIQSLFKNMDTKKEIELTATLKNKITKTRKITIIPYQNTNITYQNPSLDTPIQTIKGLKSISKYDQQEIITYLITHENNFEIKTEGNTFNEEFHGIFLNAQTRNTPGLPQMFSKIIIEKKKKDIIEILKKIDPSIKDLEIGGDGIIYCDTGLPKLFPINLMGDGIVKLLSILTAMYNYKNGIVIIDEIENGLHYSSLKSLWSGINEASKKFNVQVFATTHSWECLEAFSKTLKNENDIKLYRIDKNEENFKIVEYENDLINLSLQNNWELR
ncbi:hypothetical protein XO12_05470 [Marinitoga sp. 1154]|uniref:AAA family ATPase n=1 Tax=Marinitoga sp. 1154 TaxID=1643335 RepID=UPI001586E307|nr:ATP-binding protein [Marinitoga sp. 1154]NUU99574.1 hypothetical protein [Marinitoga sp. 1154]